MTEEGRRDEDRAGGAADSAGSGAADATGDTGVRETGDISGATSTHAGAGGIFDNTGGTGTAPTE